VKHIPRFDDEIAEGHLWCTVYNALQHIAKHTAAGAYRETQT